MPCALFVRSGMQTRLVRSLVDIDGAISHEFGQQIRNIGREFTGWKHFGFGAQRSWRVGIK
jgi:hypothetical protein